MTFSQQSHQRMIDVLDDTIFTSSAFDLKSSKEDGTTAIIFKDDPTLYIKISLEKPMLPDFPIALPPLAQKERKWDIECSPGEFLRVEFTTIEETKPEKIFAEVIHLIQRWSERIAHELKAKASASQHLRDFQTEFESHLNEKFSPDAHFTQKEISEMKEKLKSFEREFEAFTEEQNAFRMELSELKMQIASLSQKLGEVPKKTWYRSAAKKIGDIVLKVAATEAGQKLLGGGLEKLLEYTNK